MRRRSRRFPGKTFGRSPSSTHCAGRKGRCGQGARPSVAGRRRRHADRWRLTSIRLPREHGPRVSKIEFDLRSGVVNSLSTYAPSGHRISQVTYGDWRRMKPSLPDRALQRAVFPGASTLRGPMRTMNWTFISPRSPSIPRHSPRSAFSAFIRREAFPSPFISICWETPASRNDWPMSV